MISYPLPHHNRPPLLWVVLALIGTALAVIGAFVLTSPNPLGGPMALSLPVVPGVVALGLGTTLLLFSIPRAANRTGGLFASMALLISAPAAYNFLRYPPIADGAYFQLRYGHDLDLWPAAPEAQATALCFASALLYAALLQTLISGDRHRGNGRMFAVLLGASMSITVVAVYTLFVRTRVYELQTYGPALSYVGFSVLLVAAGARGLKRYQAAAATITYASTALLLFVATIAIYWI